MGVLFRRFVLSGSLLFLRQSIGIPGVIPCVVAQESEEAKEQSAQSNASQDEEFTPFGIYRQGDRCTAA